MSQMLALVILLLILFIGDLVAVRTKAWVPSIFICAVLFLIGYWTFFPQDIVAISGVPPVVATMMMYLLITNMGTLLSLQELKNQWKTIVIALSGIIGIIVLLFIVGSLLFGFKTVVVAIPPLVGGVVSALIMSEGAKEVGLASLSVFCDCYLCDAGICWLSTYIYYVEKRREASFETISKWTIEGKGGSFLRGSCYSRTWNEGT